MDSKLSALNWDETSSWMIGGRDILEEFHRKPDTLNAMCKTRSNIGPQKRLRFAVVAE